MVFSTNVLTGKVRWEHSIQCPYNSSLCQLVSNRIKLADNVRQLLY